MSRNVPEFHSTPKGLSLAALPLIVFDGQHRADPVGTGGSLGHVDDQVRHFNELHQDLGHIVVKGDHQALGQDAVLDPDGPYVHQDDNGQVDDHVGHRVHEGGDPPRHQLTPGQGLGPRFKALDLAVLFAEGPEDPDTGEILPGGRGHLVQPALDLLILGHGNEHDAKDNDAQHRDHPHEDQRRLGINGKGHNHSAEDHKGRPEQQPQRQIHAALDLIDVGGHSGNEGRGAQAVDLGIAQPQHVLQ